MNTEEVKLTQLQVNSANPRQISPEKFKKLVSSILVLPKMLQLRPIVIDDTMTTLGGNMRLRALSAISGMTQEEITQALAECRDFQRKTDAEREQLLAFWASWLDAPSAPVVRASSLSDTEQREFIIKDNIGYGDWDMDMLANDWDAEMLGDWGLDMDWAQNQEQKEVSEDDISDEDMDNAPSRCQAGQLWKLGNHRLMCGDSTNPNDVALLMDGEKANMVFTDPPYGVAIGTKNKMLQEINGGGRESGVITEDIANDNIALDDLFPILVGAMTNCRENCREDAVYYVTVPMGGPANMMMQQMMKEAGLPVRHSLIWEKNVATFSLGRLDYDYQTEGIFYTWTKSHHNYRKGEYRTNIWKYDKPQKCDLHPTMKPVALVANALLDGSAEGDIVLDMFGGSGTTLIAAEQLGRKARLMELDAHYCDVIVARWEKLTGLTAEMING